MVYVCMTPVVAHTFANRSVRGYDHHSGTGVIAQRGYLITNTIVDFPLPRAIATGDCRRRLPQTDPVPTVDIWRKLV